MTRMRISEIVLGLVLACSLFFGGPVHALVPHEHSDHHNVGESPTWQSLHASLRHEDKKTLPLFNLLTIVGIVFVIGAVFVPARRLAFVDDATEMLRRGIVPHRKFG